VKIIFITPSYYPNIGGVEYVVKSIAERLAALGHDVVVLTGAPDAHTTQEEINGVHILRWPTWAPSGAYHIPKERDQLRNLLRKPSTTPTRCTSTAHTRSSRYGPPRRRGG